MPSQVPNSPCLIGNIPGSPSNGKCITQVEEKGVGLVPFQNPFGAVGTVPAFYIRGHGLYAWGPTMEAAEMMVEACEFLLACAWEEWQAHGGRS